MNQSALNKFVEKHGGEIYDTGYVAVGDYRKKLCHAEMPHHSAGDLDMPDGVTVEPWGDGVCFELDVSVDWRG